MPRFDGTGPNGAGCGTGRRGNQPAGVTNKKSGRCMGQGAAGGASRGGRGAGAGGTGRRMGNGGGANR